MLVDQNPNDMVPAQHLMDGMSACLDGDEDEDDQAVDYLGLKKGLELKLRRGDCTPRVHKEDGGSRWESTQ